MALNGLGWKEKLFQQYMRWLCRPSRALRHLKNLLPAAPPPALRPSNVVKVAALQVKVKLYKTPLAYVEEMHRRVREAAASGASVIVFPEYNNLQLLGMLPGIEDAGREAAGRGEENDITVAGIASYITPAVQPLLIAVYSRLAAAYGVYLMAGSFLLADGERVVNRAYLFGPDGTLLGEQDKVHLMPEEKEWGISRGEGWRVFDTSAGRMAMPICMDATYYETFRVLENMGAEIVLLPIANNEPYNFWLALRGIWPRVQETPLYGVKGALVGDFLGFSFTGRAGIYAPLELTPRGDGILAETANHEDDAMVVADLDLAALRAFRRGHPWRDRNEQLYRRYFPRLYAGMV